MISLESEIASLRDREILDKEVAAKLIALERRELIALHNELRLALWLAVALVVAGVGLFLEDNIDRIGHLTLIVLIGIAAFACYAIVWHRHRAGGKSAALDFLLLLAALLLSSDIGYLESQYHIFDDAWRHHLLILAAIHAATAYGFDSRLVLSLSLTSLAGWFGIDNRGEFFEGESWFVASRLLFAGGATLLWRALHARARLFPHFLNIFDHYAAHAALLAALVLIFDDDFEIAGLVLLAALVPLAIWWGVRTRREAFVIYGFIYGVIGLDGIIANHVDGPTGEKLLFLWLSLSTPVAIAALFMIHRRWRTEW